MPSMKRIMTAYPTKGRPEKNGEQKKTKNIHAQMPTNATDNHKVYRDTRYASYEVYDEGSSSSC